MNLHNFKGIIKWIVFIFIEGCLETRAADPTDISRLRQDLLNRYNQNAVPNENEQNRTTIRISPWLMGFELDEDRSIFTFHMWCTMSWIDYKLKWDPKGYGNLTRILFTPQEIWKPDLYVYNSFGRSDIDHFGNTHIVVDSNGYIFWVPPTIIQVGIKEDLRLWPYDSQSCDAILYSWAHGSGILNLSVYTNEINMDSTANIQNREWRIVSTTMKRRSWTWGEIEYPDIYFTVNIQRRSAIHSCAIIVPGLAIATAILISFWVRPGSVERLALIMLVIIINALYLNQFYVFLKTHGDRTPLVLLFYRDSLLMVTVALVWTICLRYLAETKRTSPVPLPGFIESFLNSFPAKIFCLDRRPTIGSQSSETDDEGKLVASGNPYQADWAWLAHLLDRIAFLIYFLVYICFYFSLL